MQKDNIEDFFIKAFGTDCESMEIDVPVSVVKFGIGILSYNHKDKINEKRLVVFIIRKKDDFIYNVTIGDQIIEVTGDHKFYIKTSKSKTGFYAPTKEIVKLIKKDTCELKSIDGSFVLIKSIIKSKTKDKIFDLQVEGNENYFSNGFLSHNSMFSNPETTSGGNALKFYASQRIDIRKGKSEVVDEEGNFDRIFMKCKVIKNKLAAPFKKATMENIFGHGLDPTAEILDKAELIGLVKRAGAWYSYGETRLGQGAEKTKDLLRDNEELLAELLTKIKEHYGIK